MSEEFLELLWVLEATLTIEPELEQALDRVVSGPCFKASELPQAMPEQRQAPVAVRDSGHLLKVMGDEDNVGD